MRNRSLIVVCFMAFVLMGGVLFDGTFVAAQEPVAGSTTMNRYITVVGRGSVSVSPEIASVTLGVETKAENVANATAESRTIMTAIMAALEEGGVAEKDIQTAEYNIYFDEGIATADQPQQPVYRVINMINVIIRDLDSVGTILDSAIEAGANRIYGVNFTRSDWSEVEEKARTEAVADATERAQELASLAGVEVGEILSVSEVITGGTPVTLMPAAVQAEVASSGLGIAPGQLTFSTTIQVVFAIAPGESAIGDAGDQGFMRYLTVVGQGTSSIDPDIANVTLGVETKAAEVQQATEDNNATMDAVMQALADAGVEAKDIQTSSYNIYFDEGYRGTGMAQEPVYRVSNMVTVIVRDLDSIGDLLDSVIMAGANSIYGVNFTVEDWTPAEMAAREKAIGDASTRSSQLASLAGVELGEVLSISEVITGGSMVYRDVLSLYYGLSGGGGGIAPGQQEFSTSIQVTYAIK